MLENSKQPENTIHSLTSEEHLITYQLKKIPNHLIVAGSSWLSRIINMGSRIFTIPLIFAYLGVDQYAIFVIITALEGWAILLDFGIGSALQNQISIKRARNGDYTSLLKSALILLMILCLITIALFCLAAPYLQSFLFKNFKANIATIYPYLILIIGFIYIFTSFFSVSFRVLYAIDKGHYIHLFQGSFSLISLIIQLSLTNFYKGELSLFLMLLTITLPNFLVSFYFFWKIFLNYKIITFPKNLVEIKFLFKRGLSFAGLIVMTVLLLSTDYLIMSQTLNALAIVQYSILNKIFYGIFLFYNNWILAIWPDCTTLNSKGLFDQTRRRINHLIMYGFGLVLITLAICLLFSNWIIRLFSDHKIESLSISLIILFGIYFLIRAWTDAWSMALQSINQISSLWKYIPLQVILSCSSQYLFSKIWGINGILLGLIFSSLLTVSWALPKNFKQLAKKANRAKQAMLL